MNKADIDSAITKRLTTFLEYNMISESEHREILDSINHKGLDQYLSSATVCGPNHEKLNQVRNSIKSKLLELVACCHDNLI